MNRVNQSVDIVLPKIDQKSITIGQEADRDAKRYKRVTATTAKEVYGLASKAEIAQNYKSS